MGLKQYYSYTKKLSRLSSQWQTEVIRGSCMERSKQIQSLGSIREVARNKVLPRTREFRGLYESWSYLCKLQLVQKLKRKNIQKPKEFSQWTLLKIDKCPQFFLRSFRKMKNIVIYTNHLIRITAPRFAV